MPERAEIEAVARAISLGHGWTEFAHIDAVLTSYGPDAERAIAALDRVRDARGDDEAADDDGLCPHGWPPEFCGNCHEDCSQGGLGQ